MWRVGAAIERNSCRPLHPRDRSSVLAIDTDGKIVAVDVQGDFDILGPMAEPGGIIKPPHLAAGQNDSPHGLLVAGASFEPVSQMDGGKLVLIGADGAVIAHRDDGDLAGRTRKQGADRGLGGYQGGRIKAAGVGARGGRDIPRDGVCPAMMIREAPFTKATVAVVKARKVSITATAPLAFLAPSKRLWIEIFIAAATFG